MASVIASMGYPMHRIYVIGHLAEAEAEIADMVEGWEWAEKIRNTRKAIEECIAPPRAIHTLITELWKGEFGLKEGTKE
jgi:hypothetical protein